MFWALKWRNSEKSKFTGWFCSPAQVIKLVFSSSVFMEEEYCSVELFRLCFCRNAKVWLLVCLCPSFSGFCFPFLLLFLHFLIPFEPHVGVRLCLLRRGSPGRNRRRKCESVPARSTGPASLRNPPRESSRLPGKGPVTTDSYNLDLVIGNFRFRAKMSLLKSWWRIYLKTGANVLNYKSIFFVFISSQYAWLTVKQGTKDKIYQC
jgi:hypothetical protein